MKLTAITPGLKVVVNDLVSTPLYEVIAVNRFDVELRHVDPLRPNQSTRTVDYTLVRVPTKRQLAMHQ